MDDDEFLHAFFRGAMANQRFGHREHLRLAWLAIERHGAEAAEDVVGDGLRHFAAAHGRSERYNETLTRFWVRLVAHVRLARAGIQSVEDAADAFPILLDSRLPLRHWSASVLFGEAARRGWCEPDLLPLGF